ncbi:MAG TPA: hypothetical protein VHX60_07340 [Acidobacteriaceae bacterium]|nr:hypothetical protein [Acidobacteriaceae bacterium]
MITDLRQDFNSGFRPEALRSMLHGIDAVSRTHVAFPVAETPCFFPRTLLDEMAGIGAELCLRLVDDPVYLAASLAAIPQEWRAAGETAHPHFLTADFGLVRAPDGRLAPRLVEMQAFPSIFGFQWVLAEAYRAAFGLSDSLGILLGGLDESSFWKLLARVIVADHDPESVVLVDVSPSTQKTLPDFHITADRLGIRIVDIAEVEAGDRRGSHTGAVGLFYRNGRARVPIRRIYNRAIVDELVARQVHLQFDYREPLDVEWAGHPNWYFHVSKFALPWLSHPAVPPAVFLTDWLRHPTRSAREAAFLKDRNSLILKPLYSFAGQGIIFSPSDEQIAAIPLERRGDYLLQERVTFEPVIDTPAGPTQAEIRILYAWPDRGVLTPAICLVRLGRGKMMGVDHNRGQSWVGASAAFYPG